MVDIRNIYYMLAYTFDVLHEDQFSSLASEPFEYAADLLAAILAKGMSGLVRRGLGRAYMPEIVCLSSPAGKIKLAESMHERTLLRKQLVCERCVFTENIPANMVLKSTAYILLSCPEVAAQRKAELKKSLLFFSEVERVDLRRVRWDFIAYDKNNAFYKLLIELCRLVVEGLLMSERGGKQKWKRLLDDQKMYQLFERFVRAYYKKHYPECRVSAATVMWNLTGGTPDYLPTMKSDVTIFYRGKVLIIDTKFYAHSMQVREEYGSRTIHSENLYQIFTYVKNRDCKNTGDVSGLLLYAKTDENTVPDAEYRFGKNRISVKALDLGLKFPAISAQLDAYLTLLNTDRLPRRNTAQFYF